MKGMQAKGKYATLEYVGSARVLVRKLHKQGKML